MKEGERETCGRGRGEPQIQINYRFRYTKRWIQIHMNICEQVSLVRYKEISRQTDRQQDKQAGRCINRQTDRKVRDRKKPMVKKFRNKQTERYIHTLMEREIQTDTDIELSYNSMNSCTSNSLAHPHGSASKSAMFGFVSCIGDRKVVWG